MVVMVLACSLYDRVFHQDEPAQDFPVRPRILTGVLLTLLDQLRDGADK